MIVFTASYRKITDGYLARVLDYPGVFTSGGSLSEARKNLAGALTDVIEYSLKHNEPLAKPQRGVSDPDADAVEPIRVLYSTSPWLAVNVMVPHS